MKTQKSRFLIDSIRLYSYNFKIIIFCVISHGWFLGNAILVDWIFSWTFSLLFESKRHFSSYLLWKPPTCRGADVDVTGSRLLIRTLEGSSGRNWEAFLKDMEFDLASLTGWRRNSTHAEESRAKAWSREGIGSGWNSRCTCADKWHWLGKSQFPVKVLRRATRPPLQLPL